MTGKQHAVMWLGLLLVVVQFFTTNQFHLIWSDIISGPTPGKILGKVPPKGSTGSGPDLGNAYGTGTVVPGGSVRV
jgi:hypothetical protein